MSEVNAGRPVTIEVSAGTTVSGLLTRPARADACVVLAHGAGAGMAHPFMAAVAAGLAERRIATLRYQFPFMERGSRRPDAPGLAHATVRAAVAAAAEQCPGPVLFAGGKSFGGRMTSQTQSISPLAGVAGLVLLGFPLHPPGKPGSERAEHLRDVDAAMLFLQGTRDELADLARLREVVERLGERATLHVVVDADHSFHVRAKSGRNDAQALAEMLDVTATWMRRLM